jgi:error-prone DNA polymerase
VFENYRRVLLTSRIVGITGTLQREQEVMHVIVDEVVSLDDRLSAVIEAEQSGCEELGGDPSLRALRRTLPGGRNFH